MKKVLVISTSLHKNSNSEKLAAEFARGARESGCAVEELSLKGKKLQYCIGCNLCLNTGRCILPDDGNEMMEKVRSSDALAFATPIYYFEMCGQMKTFLDRMNPIYAGDYSFRDVYLLTCAAEEGGDTPENAENGLKGFIACFEKARFAGSVFAGGVAEEGSIGGHKALKEAYNLGRSLNSGS